jgi:hypothetical protein
MAHLHFTSARASVGVLYRVSGPANRSCGVSMASRITEHTVARLRAELAAQHPSIPAHTWHPVLRRNPQALDPEPDSGHVWIDVEGRARLLPTEYFEFTKR